MIFHDTHIHLDLMKHRQDTIKNLEHNKVYSIAVTNLPTIFQHNKITIPESKCIKHALGYHPELVKDYPDLLPVFKKELKKTRYIGEIGIDGSSGNRESIEIQEQIFSSIVSWCNDAGGKILTIHSRRAEKKIINILGDDFNGEVILHWYSGNISNLEIAIKNGYWFSVNLAMLKSQKGKEIIKKIPLNKLLVETDSPFGVSENKLDYGFIYKQIIKGIATIKEMNYLIVETALDDNFRELLRQ